MRKLASRLLLAAAAAVASNLAVAQPLTQSFDDISTLAGAGWVFVNNSSSAGTTGWFQGNTAVFPSQGGVSYVAANLNGATFGGNISNWLITPQLANLQNGEALTFFTRTEVGAPAADRLEVRLSLAGPSSNVGATDASVGDFTRLLLTVNPALTVGGYPTTWTLFTVSLSGLPAGPGTGRIAFRHFVPNTSTNADSIGIDTLNLTAPSADLSISNAPSSGTITGGTNVTYTLVAANGGPSQADSVTVTYNLPSPLSFVSCLATNGGVCGGSGSNRTVTYGSIASAASSTITMVAALPCSAAHGSVISGTANVASAITSDPVSSNDSATAVFAVNGALPASAVTAPGAVGTLSPARTASVPSHPGSTYAWTITNGTITAGQGTSGITFTAGVVGTLTLGVTETSSAGCASAPGSATVNVLAPGSAMLLYPLTPCRLLDTRNAAGPLGAPSLAPSGSPDRAFVVTGVCGIPSDARAVSVNVTVTNVQAGGALLLYRGDGSPTTASTVSFRPGVTRANNAQTQLALDGSGTFRVRNSSAGTLDLIVDVNGFYR
jgi:uncharacterized repeat protein (TIGR01451 family)